MTYAVLSREDYIRLILLSGVNDVPKEIVEAILSREYPKQTGQAVGELRTRGLDVRLKDLHYVINTGKIDRPPVDDAENLQWTPEHIDQAAEHFAAAQKFTPGAWAYHFEGVSHAQELEAQYDARRRGIGDFLVKAVRELIWTDNENGPVKFVHYREATAQDRAIAKGSQ